ncbi:restriction endonuclease subunit S [Caldifermentibacillus hisashii]|uniref:restriction endonuclease subunit S n=1 Tax=Caldifermentibacillus hisashii TaxID=996558 RepID=UPI0031FDE23D
MKKIKLKEIFEIKKGKKVEPVDESCPNKVRYIQIEDLRDDRSVKYCFPDDNYVYANSESIIIAWDGANAGTVSYGLEGAIGSTLAVLEAKTKDIYIPFVGKFLQSKFQYLRDTCTGATIPHISRKALENLLIPMPSFEEQVFISKILDKAQSLVETRKAQIESLDQLTQSVFLEMFGDPITNPKNWVKLTLPEFSSKDKYSIKRGPFGGALKKEIFVKEGYLVYEQYHAINDDFSMERYFIDEKKFEELKAFEVKPKDLIISCSGVTLGRIAEIPLNAPKGIINQALLKLTLDSNKMNNTFFKFLFRHPNIQDILFGFSRGSGIPNFPPMSEVKSIEFICPPIELQNDFEKKVNIILQKKTAFEKGLNKVEYFFSSIMQQSFKGELFTKEKVTSL